VRQHWRWLRLVWSRPYARPSVNTPEVAGTPLQREAEKY